jgi:hypothetical protein
MRIILLLSVIITFISCKKVENSSVIPPTEDPIKFNTNIDTVNTINSDSLKFTLSLESKIPSLGVTYFIDVANSSNSSIFKINGNTTSSYIDIVVNELKFKGSYKINIQVASKSDPTNSSGKTLSISRGSIYKNYLTTSYELSKYDFWYSSSQLFKVDGGKYLNNPFIDEQSVQVDINSDGYEDVFYFEGYDLNISPTPNPPPTIFFSKDERLTQSLYKGPSIKNPHGTKLLVGDFNNDSLPDIFSNVAVDPPFGAFPLLQDNNHLILNSSNGFSKVIEFPDGGFWYTGCSGDIDKDGDLDIITFNFHYPSNGVKSRIMWNDGKANFQNDFNGIGTLPVVYQSELFDVNSDGFLDLVVVFVPNGPSRINDFRVLWGNGKDFSLNNSTKIDIPGDQFLMNLDFLDIDKDGFSEILQSGTLMKNNVITYYLSLHKSDDKGKTFTNKTTQYIENDQTSTRFFHIRVQDIDKNGSLDIFSSEKKDNLRWEWNGTKFVRK